MAERPERGEAAVREAYCRALTTLLTEREVGLHDVTATELSHEAGLSRRTFYRYFDKVEDVLDELARRTARTYAADLSGYLEEQGGPISFRQHMVLTFSFMDERRALLGALKRDDLLERFLTALWGTYEQDWLPASVSLDGRQRQRLARMSTAAISAAVVDWVDDDEAPTPEQMGPIMEELVANMPLLSELRLQNPAPERFLVE